MRTYKAVLLIIVLFLFAAPALQAQVKILRGEILDKQSDEPIPFASVVFKINGRGVLTDSLGQFEFTLRDWANGDTLQINSVGYKPLLIPFSSIKDSSFVTVHIEVLPPQHEAIVKVKYNRALWFWRKIIAHKPKNDRHKWQNYSYEIYNKLELDIDNINKDKLEKNKLLKPLSFVLSYVDTTSEKKPYLPVYLIETLSDYYYQTTPPRSREVIKASITNGIDNESIMKQLGGTYQNVDVYSNTIPVFDKEFISPFGDNGDNFYNFKLQDTQYLNKKRLVHFAFSAKRKGENTFEGDCWVNDTSFAIQKITMRPQLEANINFVTGLSIIQEFKLINDSTWFLYKDKFVADIAPIGDKKLSFKGRKTATYKNVVVNDTSVTNELAKSKAPEDIVLIPKTDNMPDSFWQAHRHEPLNNNEQTVYKVLDTLEKNKTYIHWRNTINFLVTGTKDIGNVRIGPWYYWSSGDQWEGTRLRFDLASNQGFSKHLYLHGYAAYGFTDQKLKGKAEVKYLFSRQPWSYISASYKNDLDNGQTYYDQLGSDNVFALFFRKANVTHKFQNIEEKRLEYYTESNKGFAFGAALSDKQFTPLQNLPGKELFPPTSGTPFNNFEASVRLRYAYSERFIEDNFLRTSLGSDYPIAELKFTHGFQGVLNSSYTYNKIDFTVSDYLNIAPYGSIYYNVYAGKIFGTLPYQLLDILPGNDWHYYSRYSFNLMYRYQYLADSYAGFNIEHNIGSGLFRYIPLTRKLKLRQVWTAKGVIGNLSDANKQLNFVGSYPFQSLDKKLYLELGTGVDNIFKLFRVDFVWRVLPTPLPKDIQQKFGIFFGFRVSL